MLDTNTIVGKIKQHERASRRLSNGGFEVRSIREVGQGMVATYLHLIRSDRWVVNVYYDGGLVTTKLGQEHLDEAPQIEGFPEGLGLVDAKGVEITDTYSIHTFISNTLVMRDGSRPLLHPEPVPVTSF